MIDQILHEHYYTDVHIKISLLKFFYWILKFFPLIIILTRNAVEKLAFKSTKNVIGSLMMAKINGHLIIINHWEMLPNTDLGELSLIGSKLTHS